jgi:hypothetical protein
MRKSIYWIGVVLAVLVATGLACGGKEEPTATPAPTAPLPTATPAPSPTPAPPALEMIEAESETHGVRLCYPEGWFYEESFALILSSDPDFDLFAADEEVPDGVVMVIMTGSAEEIQLDQATEEMLVEMASEYGGEDVELLGEPERRTIHGADVLTVEFRGTREGESFRGRVAVYTNGEQGGAVWALSRQELWEAESAAVDAVMACIELFEGTGLDVELEAEAPIWRGELSYGETVQAEFAGGEIHSWTFVGVADETISIVATPLGEGMDVSIRLVDSADESLVDVDEAYGDQAETLSGYQLPGDGEYTILVEESWDVPGIYELQLLEASATAEDEPGAADLEGMVLAESEAQGVRLAYPEGWFYDDAFILLVANDPAAMTVMGGDTSELDAVVVVVVPFPADEAEEASFEELYDEVGSVFTSEDDAQVEMVGPPEQVIINGADVQLVESRVTQDDVTTHVKFAIFNNGEQAAVVLAAGPQDAWADNVHLVDAIIRSIELFEGTGSVFEMPLVAGEVRGSLDYDMTVEDQFTGGESHLWTFNGNADDYVSIVVTPLDEEMDIKLQLQSADGTRLVDVDDGFSGEGEVLSYQLPADGEYQILVEEYWDVGGGYELRLLGGAEPVGVLVPPGVVDMGDIAIGEPVERLLKEGQHHAWTFVAEGGEVVVITATPLADETDLTLTVIDPHGIKLVEDLDDAFSGDAEEWVLELAAPGAYLILVSEYWEAEGSYALSVDLGG